MLRFAFLASAVGAYVAPTAHVRQAATRTPHAAMQFGGQGLPRRKADPEVPPVVVTGKTTGNLLFGKLQRAAQLPGARLGQTYAAVEDRGKLSSLLWSSFAMAAVTSGNWLDRDEMVGTYALEGALLFIDCTSADAGGGGFSLPSLPNPFAPKPAKAAAGGGGAAPEVDEELLKFAAARGAQHAYLLVDGDDAAVASAVAACEEAIGGFEGGSVTLCVTILAPVGGATLESTKGWAAETTAQDHEGVLSTPLSALVGYAPKLGVRKTEAASSGASAIPREDFAELATQVALRLGRTAAEGAPAVRVVRVVPAESGDSLVERPLSESTYEGKSMLGPKGRARLGSVASADWSRLLAPFGVYRVANPGDNRELIVMPGWEPPTPPEAEGAEEAQAEEEEA